MVRAERVERPVQFINIDDAGRCHLEDGALAMLRETPSRMAVIGIAGLNRTGKSFLLNQLLGCQTGFEVGPTAEPCTRGLWMWGRPVKLAPNYHCLLIDSEGLGSSQRTTSCDMQIFSLCVLLSSYLIYNSMGAIDEEAVEGLHLVLKLARHVRERSTREGGNDAEEEEPPSFLWVLRDFHLRLVDECGAAITARDYLEDALEPVPGDATKSAVRGAVRDVFPRRDCATLVRPMAEEAELRDMGQLSYESLRPEFRSQVESLASKVFTALKPKQIGDAVVSGPMLADLASKYCEAINSTAAPVIQSAWASAQEAQLQKLLQEAVLAYTRRMEEEVLGRLPVSEAQFQDGHREAEAEALRLFEEAPSVDRGDRRFLESRTEVAGRLSQLRERAEADNTEASRRQCQAVAEELYEQMVGDKLSSRGSYDNFEELSTDWTRLRAEYLGRTAGPAQAEVLAEWLMERMTESMQRVHEQLRGAANDRCSALQQDRPSPSASAPLPSTLSPDGRPTPKRRARRPSEPEDSSSCRTMEWIRPSDLSMPPSCRTIELDQLSVLTATAFPEQSSVMTAPAFPEQSSVMTAPVSVETMEAEQSSSMTMPISISSLRASEAELRLEQRRAAGYSLVTHTADELRRADALRRASREPDVSSPPVQQECGAHACSLQ